MQGVCTPTLTDYNSRVFDGHWTERGMRAGHLSSFALALTGTEEVLWDQTHLDSTPALLVT